MTTSQGHQRRTGHDGATDHVGGAGQSRRGFLRAGGRIAVVAALPPALSACSGSSDTLRLVGVTDQQQPVEELLALYRESRPGESFTTSFAPTEQMQTVVRTQLAGATRRTLSTRCTPAAAARCPWSSWPGPDS